ncbi:MAG: all3515 family Zur-repressed PEP-CTERM protein [Microcystaceae cyanobacterium]
MLKFAPNPFSQILIVLPLTGLSLLTSSSLSLAQTGGHSNHHHLMIGRDNRAILPSGTYAGVSNPNYNRLSLLFPHLHDPVSTSGFHGIGIYSYIGPTDNPTIIPTNTNNQLPETGQAPPLSLTTGQGVFANKVVSGVTEQNMYSDLKMKPVAHLKEDLDDPFAYAIYHAGNDRWNGLLGDDASISIELVSISPGLGVANEQGQNLFSNLGDTYLIGQGDHFSFTPIFYADPSTTVQTYSASFRLLDTNSNNGRTPWLPSGTFSMNFQANPVPEPPTILASLALLGMLGLFRHYKAKINTKLKL